MAWEPYTGKPWNLETGRIDRSRILVLANSSVDWSVAENQYYCQKRGIPVANVVPFAFGNGGSPSTVPQQWTVDVWATALSTLVVPLSARARAMNCTGIILGAGVPVGVRLPDWADPTVPGDVEDLRVASLADLVSICGWPGDRDGGGVGTAPWANDEIKTVHSNGFVYIGSYGNTPIPFGKSLALWTLCFPGAIPSNPKNQQPTVGGLWPLSALNGLDISFRTWTLPSDSQTFTLGHPRYHWGDPIPVYKQRCSPALPVGKLGIGSAGGGYYGAPPVAETQAYCRDLIDRVTTLMTAHRQAEALRKPVLFNLTDADGGIKTAVKWSYVRWLCETWGMNTKYGIRDVAFTDAQALAYSGASSKRYDNAAILAGQVVDEEYYMMLGGWDNIDFYNAPYANAWKPLPGAGVMMGPSRGFEAANRALVRGAACVRTDAVHTITTAIDAEPGVFHNLLRGMTWLEAFFFGGCVGSYPCGDPLWAPYGPDPDTSVARSARRRAPRGTRLRKLA